jgi:hypothetical protein
MDAHDAIDPTIPPGSAGCAACEAESGWWLHLRRCASCGNIGCCDSSPSQHARAHFESTGHPIVRSFEPGESWFWDFEREAFGEGPTLASPLAHPDEQGVPGPAERVPADWRDRLNP